MLGAKVHFPPTNFFGYLDNGIISSTYEGPHRGVFRGHLFGFLCLGSSGVPLMPILLDGGHIVEQTLQ